MISTFFHHQKQKFFRNPRWKSGIMMKILFGTFIFYLISLSFQVEYFLSEFKPDVVPVDFINSYLIYVFGGFFITGFFIQKIPFENIQHYLHLNIRKNWIVNFLLLKTLLGNKTVIVMALFTPFAFVSVVNSYSLGLALVWLLNIYFIMFCINLVVQMLKFFFQINIWFRLFLLLIFVAIGSGIYLDFFQAELWSQPLFGYVFQSPIMIVIPMIITVMFYMLNFYLLKKAFYPDRLQEKRFVKSMSGGFDILNIFGENKELIRYNVRQVFRNKKCKIQYIIFSLFPLIYSFQIYDYLMNRDSFIFVYWFSLFIYFIVCLNYLSFFFAWESGTMDFIQTSKIAMKDFIFSKVIAILILTAFHYIPEVVMVYFSPQYFLILISTILVQYGLFICYTVYVSMFGISKMDINKSPFFNYEGSSSIHFVMVIPAMIIPLIPIIIFYKNPQIGYAINAILGIIGLILANKFVAIIDKKFQKDKYLILDELR